MRMCVKGVDGLVLRGVNALTPQLAQVIVKTWLACLALVKMLLCRRLVFYLQCSLHYLQAPAL